MDRLSVRLRTYLWTAQMKGLTCDCMLCIGKRVDRAINASMKSMAVWPKWAPLPKKPPKENA